MIHTYDTQIHFSRDMNGETVPFEEKLTCFRLDTKASTYFFAASDAKFLLHGYYGSRAGQDDLSFLLHLDVYPHTVKSNLREKGVIMGAYGFEYPCHGIGDYREACLMIEDKDGMTTCDFRYVSHEVMKGKPKLSQKDFDVIPATFEGENSCETLKVTLQDSHTDLTLELYYSVFEELDVITRSARLVNGSGNPVTIRRIFSTCVDYDDSDFEMITLNGSWGRERVIERYPLHHGKQLVDSICGESSAQSNPFAALVRPGTDEEQGEVYGFNLVYSGNFTIEAQVDQQHKTRLVAGIHDYDFAWLLEPGYDFWAPECVMTYSASGLGTMSRNFHDLYRGNLIRSKYVREERPILINNWEATFFDFDTEKLLSIARESAKLGIEMLVMDDGWFGRRDNDDSSLGDWKVNEEKLPGGLKYLVDEVNKLGMKFGIWFEPEMVSLDSELFRAHPDWAIQVPGRELTLRRGQFVLDYSRKDVRDYVYSMMTAVLRSANIEYVKWDMNRSLTEVGSALLPAGQQREVWHRYVLGVYDLMNRLTTDFPDILLENCSSGGARFDPGMLYFSPQIWTSDNTDAVERLKIQMGTSLCYPPSAMGAHVSVSPSQAVGRATPFATRGDVAMAGTFGYELDVTEMSEEDLAAVPKQIETYKKYRHLVLNGDYYRLSYHMCDAKWNAWEFVAKDRSEALVTVVQVMSRANSPAVMIKPRGLDPEAMYLVEEVGSAFSGETLMNCGLRVDLWGDFVSKRYHLVIV